MIYPDLGFVKVIGKNNKERIVPIGSEALKHIALYTNGVRRTLKMIAKGSEDIPVSYTHLDVYKRQRFHQYATAAILHNYVIYT